MLLGKKPATFDERDFLYADLRAKQVVLPKIPQAFGHGTMYRDWLMLGNGPDDTVEPGFQGAGDCVWAGAAHETMETNHLAGKVVTFTGANVISDYSACTGYVLDDPSTDNGSDVRTALKYRQTTGIVDSKGVRHKIGAFVALQVGNWDQLMEAAYIFSAVGVGVQFPNTAMDQFNNGENWDVVAGATIEGGHYIPVMGRSTSEICGVVSWGKRVGMTKNFYETYCDEAWAIIFPEELRNGKNEHGFNLSYLTQALQEV